MARIVQRSKHKLNLMVTGLAITALVSLTILLLACGILPSTTAKISPFAIALFAVVLLSSVYFIYHSTKRLNDKSPGLIISEEGITYNMSPIGKAIGRVRWEDVKQLKETEDIIVAVVVKNPDYYTNQVKNSLLRKQLKKLSANIKRPGTILLLSANGLECDYDELKRWLSNGLEEYRSTEKNLS